MRRRIQIKTEPASGSIQNNTFQAQGKKTSIRDKQEARTGSELNLHNHLMTAILTQTLTHSRAHALGHPQPALRCCVVSGIFFPPPRTLSGGKDEAVTRDHREADSSTLGPNLEGILTHSHRRRDAHTGFPIVFRLVEAKAKSVACYTAVGRRNKSASVEATHIE